MTAYPRTAAGSLKKMLVADTGLTKDILGVFYPLRVTLPANSDTFDVRVTSDANPRVALGTILGNAAITLGDGTAAPDTVIQRTAANQMTVGAGVIFNVPAATYAVTVRVAGDTFDRLGFGFISGASAIVLGGGGATADVTLVRSGVGTAQFTGTITMAAPVITGHPTIEGVTSTGSTGTGAVVFSASPTFTGTVTAAASSFSGHMTVEGVTSTGSTGTGKFVWDTSPTISGPTLTGTVAATGGAVNVTDATASDGKINVTVANIGVALASVNVYSNSADTQPMINLQIVNNTNPAICWGPGGTTATDCNLTRTGAAALSLVGQLTIATGLTITGGKDIALSATTGTKIATASTQKMAFWGATPIVRPTGWAAWTGTLNRATKATGSAVLADDSQTIGALVNDLISIGLLGA